MGAFGYADDGVLASPTVTSLKLMLDICNDFGKEFNVMFNITKYQLFHYSDDTFKGLYYNNVFVESSTCAIHLGHYVGPDGDTKAIEEGINSFFIAFNCIMSMFPNAHTYVKYTLFKSYCMALYGCVLWNLTDKLIVKFYTSWRKCIRRLLHVSNMTHCKYLAPLCDDYPVDVQIYKRVIKFVNKCLNSHNQCVILSVNLALNGSNSNICKYLNRIAYECKSDKYKLLKSGIIDEHLSKLNSIELNNILDLIHLRETNSTHFTISEINDLLNYFCTS